jgi:hypothetical protein
LSKFANAYFSPSDLLTIGKTDKAIEIFPRIGETLRQSEMLIASRPARQPMRNGADWFIAPCCGWSARS